MLKTIRQFSLYIAWLIAVVALLFSLFASELFMMPVCTLCWYQRICIYPLGIILGIASFYNDLSVVKYSLPLSILGFLFALYQYLEQMIPNFSPIPICSQRGPACTFIHFKLLGFITFPFLSVLATLAISLLLICAYKTKNETL